MIKLYKILFFSICCISTITSQKYIQTKEETANKANIEKITAEFNDYWNDKVVGKGQGYKQTLRWLNHWEMRLDENGEIPAAGRNVNTVADFKRTNPSSLRNGNTFKWTNLGPSTTVGGYNGLGRVNSIGFHPTDEKTIYAGSAGGGLWKTTTGGNAWVPLTEDIGAMGVSGIVVEPTNPNIVYIATGDGDGRDNYSVGVLKSFDGGSTWNKTGLDWTTSSLRVIRKLVRHPQDPNVLLIAASNGIWRTLNAGTTWTLEISGNFFDLEYSIVDEQVVFYGSHDTRVFRSRDLGDNWQTIRTLTGTNRLAIATTPANANIIYILASRSSDSGLEGIHKTSDAGATWTKLPGVPNVLNSSATGPDGPGQGSYDLVITVSPTDSNAVHTGGVNHWKSDDGGATWKIKSHWSSSVPFTVHADKHALEFRGNDLYEGNDGGVYITKNGGDTWTDLSNSMVISQMYRVGIAQSDITIITGLQDNGTKARVTTGGWLNELGGDGMECYINPINSKEMYGAIQNGELRRSLNGGTTWTDIQNNVPGAPAGAWITPHLLDPQDPSIIYAGYRAVWKSSNKGTTWAAISPEFTTSNITLLAVAPSDPNVIYAGLPGTSGYIRRTIDGGANWSTITLVGSDISWIKVHPANPNIIYASRSNYSGGAKIYQSNDGGMVWSNISGNLPNIPANCIEYYQNGKNGLFVGMDIGIYYRDDESTNWTLVSDGIPNVEIRDIEIQKELGKIFVATYGRGIWVGDVAKSIPLCTAPTNGIFEKFDGSSAKVSWSGSKGPVLGYEWEISELPVAPKTGFPYADTYIESVNGLAENKTFYLHVRAQCSISEYSEWFSTSTKLDSKKCGKTTLTTSSNTISSSELGAKYSWLSCNDNSIIEGANQQSFKAPANGSYKLVINHNGCLDTTSCVNIATTGIELDVYNLGLIMSPNPTQNIARLTSSTPNNNLIGKWNISIVNTLGVEIQSFKVNAGDVEINLSTVPSGNYYVRVFEKDKINKTFKLEKI
jgi:photosystem II stability/assembly factor-like uncharacterized protein